jgi:hypothetical protein
MIGVVSSFIREKKKGENRSRALTKRPLERKPSRSENALSTDGDFLSRGNQSAFIRSGNCAN